MQLIYCYTDGDGTTIARFWDEENGQNVLVETNEATGTWLETRENMVN